MDCFGFCYGVLDIKRGDFECVASVGVWLLIGTGVMGSGWACTVMIHVYLYYMSEMR